MRQPAIGVDTGPPAPIPAARADDADPRRARLLATAGIAGALISALLVGALHLLPGTSEISPIRRTISEYALTDSGWAFNLGTVALALGSLAVIAALVHAGHTVRWSVGSLLGLAWAAALVVIVLFPKHNWAVGPSTNGQIHRVASIVAFLCLPVAVMLLTRRRAAVTTSVTATTKHLRHQHQRHPIAARSAFWLAVLSLAWFSPLVGAMVLSPITQTPWYRAVPLGLVERGLVISEVLAVIALGVWALTSTRLSSTTPAPTTLTSTTATSTTPSRHRPPANQVKTAPAA